MLLIFLFALGLCVAAWSHKLLAKRLMATYVGGEYSLVQESWACITATSLFLAMWAYRGLAVIMFFFWLAG